jgi:hypothetical protein
MCDEELLVRWNLQLAGTTARGSETADEAGATSTAPISTTTRKPISLELANFSHEGGCGKTIYVANKTWTHVVEFRLGRVGESEPGVPIEFDIGDGVSVTFSVGEKMGNLFCTDVLEGDEKIDSVYKAISGTAVVTLDAPFPNQLDNERVIATVVASDLVFETEPSATIKSLTVSAPIGWLPG